VFVFLGYDPSADGRGVAKDRVIGTSGDLVKGPRKDGASVRMEEVLLFATKDGKRPGGGEKDRVIGTSGDREEQNL
jgi:hypothetical protein